MVPTTRPLALVLGFAGSRPGHFQPLLAWYAARGFEPLLHIGSVTASLIASARGAVRAGQRLAARPGVHVVHSFSNNGFISASHVVEVLAAASPTQSSTVGAFIFDSGPGFPPGDGAATIAQFYARGLGPMVSSALGIDGRFGGALVPPIRAVLTAYLAFRPTVTHAIARAPSRFVAHRPACPQLYLQGGRDTVALHAEVKGFAAAEAARGVPIGEVLWPELGHLAGWFRKREAYLEALDRHLARAGLGTASVSATTGLQG